MDRLPLNVQTAYSDLLARLQDDAVAEVGGKPMLKTVRGRKYWYARIYVGHKARDKYLGPDTAEMRERVERLRQQDEDRQVRQRRRRQLVQALQVTGLPRTDAATGKVLQALARAGVFRLRAVLVGTHAFRLYPLILGVQMPEAFHATEDVDVAQFHEISVALDDRAEPGLEDALADVGDLMPANSLYPRQPTGYRVGGDTLVEILTPNRGPDRDEPLELPALGAHAKALRFLDFLLANAIPAAVPHRYGILVNVPQPARYAVHKLIVANRRSQSVAAKRRKDLEQAAALIRIIAGDQPEELADAWHEAAGRGSQWQSAVTSGAKGLPRDAQDMLARAIADPENGAWT
jgi:hypothetical protein